MTNPSPKEVLAKLEDARRKLEGGWIQGALNNAGSYCLVGAISGHYEDVSPLGMRARELVANHIPSNMRCYSQFDNRANQLDSILFNYNDYPGIERKYVLAVVDAAIADARLEVVMGDIGDDQREVEFEPFPAEAPVEPVVVPQVPEKEPVPA